MYNFEIWAFLNVDYIIKALVLLKPCFNLIFPPADYVLGIRYTKTYIYQVFAIYSSLSLANFSSFCYLQSTVTSKFTENLLVTDDCQQQISRLLASDSRLSPASSLKKCITNRAERTSSSVLHCNVTVAA